ncbi:MAG: hypothetical protein Kow00124_19290 [Anaerolineae bacterium]
MKPAAALRAVGGSLVLALAVMLGAAGCTPAEPTIPPRPTVIVITAQGPYFAGFDDPTGWLVGGGGSSEGQVIDGRYLLTVTRPDTLAWTHQQRSFGDGVYEVEATLISGAEASGYGLLLLGSSDVGSFIYCMITGDGRYDIGYCEEGCQRQESLIGGLTLAYAIRTGGETNYLRVDLNDGQLNFIVNGVAVSQVSGLTYSQGLVGLVGESSHFGGFQVAFDNLSVVEDGGG